MSVLTAVRATSTPAEEKRLAKELSPAVAWPTLALAVALPALFWSLVAAGLSRQLPLWVCTPVLSLVSYAHYTLVHESIHGNLAPGAPRLRWLNSLVGWVGALGMGLSWPMLMRTHLLHHAHTNTDQDPDIFVKGTFAQLLVKMLIYVPTSLIPLPLARRLDPAQYQSLAGAMQPAEVAQDTLVSLATLASLGLAVWSGHTLDWLCLFFIPTRIAALLLAVFFQWLPHYPFDHTERYLNTRISLWPGGALLTLQQNLHLMHHLWPSVPFYNYARLYRRLRPTLVDKGSRIQGLMVGRFARDRSAD
ncbi:MAG TPA: fatty acid desaturase [Caulobacteraceae bacterium]|jgi:fatty acid desaturase|nr:fatty acid desaturase [Caulobacteraceae bacterium]